MNTINMSKFAAFAIILDKRMKGRYAASVAMDNEARRRALIETQTAQLLDLCRKHDGDFTFVMYNNRFGKWILGKESGIYGVPATWGFETYEEIAAHIKAYPIPLEPQSDEPTPDGDDQEGGA